MPNHRAQARRMTMTDSQDETIRQQAEDALRASLNKEGVAYVVIGRIAVPGARPYRTTRDLDVLIEPTLDNARKARRAVAGWGSFDPEYTAEERETSKKMFPICDGSRLFRIS